MKYRAINNVYCDGQNYIVGEVYDEKDAKKAGLSNFVSLGGGDSGKTEEKAAKTKKKKK